MTTKLYSCDVTQDYAKGQSLGNWDAEIFFQAPIDLLVGDKIIVDPGSGQPLVVYRNGRKFWEFDGHYASGSMTVKFDANPEGLQALYDAFKRARE